ncbi:MAG: hypothetical protein EU541_07995 [Promethearchaeota archaeon]|nr:MAG: hypothetical protein EU541_07995 [Candidatus Lokiarchaeota archaeon]
MEKDSDISVKEEEHSKFNKLSFKIPESRRENCHDSENKINIKIKREPKKSAREYLDILKKLDILLNQPFISEAKRNDYCKSQRYFMKLYLKLLEEQGT